MTHLATHIRIFNPDPSDEFVEKRTAAIGEIAAGIKARRNVEELLRTANDLAAASRQGGELSVALTDTIEAAIRKSSTAFVADGHQLEMIVCGLSGALQAISGASALSHGALSIADVMSFGLWSSLSFQKPRSELQVERLRNELMEAAHRHCDAVARDGRKRLEVHAPEFVEVNEEEEDGEAEAEAGVDVAAMNAGLKPFKAAIASLRSNAILDREEIDLLWWVMSDWSTLLGRRFSGDKVGAAAAVASGIEAGGIMRRPPAEAHRHLILRNVVIGKSLSLTELMTAIGQERTKLAPRDAKQYILDCPGVFPLLNALLTGEVSPDASSKIKRPPEDWAGRALLETSIVRMCLNISGVSV